MTKSAAAFKKVCRLAGRAVAEYRMIRPGDRIAVGVSGGKDSMMLLEVLQQLRRRAPVEFAILAVTFDPGFAGFNAAAVAGYCRERGWEHRTVAMALEPLLKECQAERRPCVLCSRLRRGKLYGAAADWRADKLALGHNLDDIAVSLLIGLFRGQGVTTMGPNVPADEAALRLIRPLALVPESLVREAAEGFDWPEAGACRYAEQLKERGDRAFFGNWLERLEKRIPHVRQQMLRSMQDVRPAYLLDKRFIEWEEQQKQSNEWGRE